MNERALRTVLLIQAIEETDRSGDVLPVTDRAEATREAAPEPAGAPQAPVRAGAQTTVQTGAPIPSRPGAQPSAPEALSSSETESFLVRRAKRLLAQLRSRSPGIDDVLAVTSGAGLGRLTVVLALTLGLVLAAFDGGASVDLFAWPLMVLILWNLIVYATLIASWFKRHSSEAPAPMGPRAGSTSVRLYERWMRGRVEGLLHHSNRFNAPLSAGLRRFANDWREVAHPLLILRARRLLHWGASFVSVGYVIGVAVKGLVLRYPAEWSASVLGAKVAHVLLLVLYGPASALSGAAIPSSDDLATLQGTAVAGGNAGAWVELIAWTALLYIVIPRLLAALATTIHLWTVARRPEIPPALTTYARVLLAEKATAGTRSASIS